MTHSSDLRNIHQLTEEDQETCKVKAKSRANVALGIDEHDDYIEEKKIERGVVDRCTECFKHVLKKIIGTTQQNQFQFNESEITKEVAKLRNQKKQVSSVLPAQIHPRKTIVLDLDETLIHTTFRKPKNYDFSILLPLPNHTNPPQPAYVTKRFGLDLFLYSMSQFYQLILFTASRQEYVDMVLAEIDPKGRISGRLCRQHCVIVNKEYYLKDLRLLGRDLSKVILIDDNSMGGMLFPDNFYKIQPFYGSNKDRHLLRANEFLTSIKDKNIITPISSFKRSFQNSKRIPKPPQLNHDLNSKSPAFKSQKYQQVESASTRDNCRTSEMNLWKLRA